MQDAHTSKWVPPAFDCLVADDSALPVLTAARDMIHAGWTLLNHPLYGNFRPHQQPYRSLLLQFERRALLSDNGVARVVPDAMSLHLIEEAFAVYTSVSVLSPDKAPAALAEACSLLDCELMRHSMLETGWLEGAFGLDA